MIGLRSEKDWKGLGGGKYDWKLGKWAYGFLGGNLLESECP